MSIQNTTEPIQYEPYTLTCTATIVPIKFAPQLLQHTVLGWLGPDGEELTSNSDIIVGQREILQNKTTITLMFKSLNFLNEITYKCKVKSVDTDVSNVSSFYIDVIGKDANFYLYLLPLQTFYRWHAHVCKLCVITQ